MRQEGSQRRQEVAKSSTATAAPKAPKAPKPAAEPRKVAGYPRTAKITIAVDENPKRKGSGAHIRFAKYKNGQSIQSALDAGITPADIKWDLEKGFIKLAA